MDESDKVMSQVIPSTTIPELSKLWFEIAQSDASHENGTSTAVKKMTDLMTNGRHAKVSSALRIIFVSFGVMCSR